MIEAGNIAMRTVILSTLAALLGLVIFTAGNGLFSTLTTIRLDIAGASTLMIGLISAAYYFGLVLGSFRTERVIFRIGHIRAYAAFASICATFYMMHGLYVEPKAWIVLRLVVGLATAGIFVVIESWLLAKSTPQTRGKVLAIYNALFYAAQGTGQFLLNVSSPTSLVPFCLASMLASFSVIPLAMTYSPSPSVEESSMLSFPKIYQLTPLGIWSCFAAGLVLSATYSMLPLYANTAGHSVSDIAIVMSLVIFGGMALQYPVGHLSDLINRRKMLLIVTLICIGLSSMMLVISPNQHMIYYPALFLLGGFTFTLYPLGVSYACDYFHPNDIVGGTQGLLLAYSMGAAIGPIGAATCMHHFGPASLFIYFAAVCSVLAVYILFRMTQNASLKVSEQDSFIAVPHTTPIATELDPRAEETLPSAEAVE